MTVAQVTFRTISSFSLPVFDIATLLGHTILINENNVLVRIAHNTIMIIRSDNHANPEQNDHLTLQFWGGMSLHPVSSFTIFGPFKKMK